jgi:Na+/proline symporter
MLTPCRDRYAAGACVQVFLFAQNAAKLKLNAPNAHTYLEVLGERWGIAGHLTFMFFGLATNVIGRFHVCNEIQIAIC